MRPAGEHQNVTTISPDAPTPPLSAALATGALDVPAALRSQTSSQDGKPRSPSFQSQDARCLHRPADQAQSQFPLQHLLFIWTPPLPHDRRYNLLTMLFAPGHARPGAPAAEATSPPVASSADSQAGAPVCISRDPRLTAPEGRAGTAKKDAQDIQAAVAANRAKIAKARRLAAEGAGVPGSAAATSRPPKAVDEDVRQLVEDGRAAADAQAAVDRQGAEEAARKAAEASQAAADAQAAKERASKAAEAKAAAEKQAAEEAASKATEAKAAADKKAAEEAARKAAAQKAAEETAKAAADKTIAHSQAAKEQAKKAADAKAVEVHKPAYERARKFAADSNAASVTAAKAAAESTAAAEGQADGNKQVSSALIRKHAQGKP